MCTTSVKYLGFVVVFLFEFLKCITLGFGCTWDSIWGCMNTGHRRDECLSYVGTQYS